jgi:hypothetical protein
LKKLLTAFAMLTVITTPVFAQSFDPENGTGNVLSFSSSPAVPDRVATRANGLHAFASAPGVRVNTAGRHGRRHPGLY